MRLAALYLYPLKSGRGIPVDTSAIGATGLRHDRRWMIVDAGGRFVTQRTDPRLGRIVPALEPDGLAAAKALRLSAPGLPELRVPVDPEAGAPTTVTVWDDTVEALGCGDEADAWLTRVLGPGHRLVAMADDAARPLRSKHARPGDAVSFADGYPYLLTSTASLADLSRRAGLPLEMERFRPNLVVDGATPFAEDSWSSVTIGSVPFRVVKPCVRCVVTTLDPRTGVGGHEPLRTLATFRRDASGGVTFGQNLIADGGGTLRVGDDVIARQREARPGSDDEATREPAETAEGTPARPD